MNYESKAKLVMNRFDIGDMCCSLPILLDEYYNVLDVTETIIMMIFSGSNYNSTSKDKKGVSKGSHFQLIRGSRRTSLIYLR